MIQFTKMHGLGNDFVVIDGIRQQIQLNAEQIRLIADRHLGVGCDQLLLVEKPAPDSSADFKYRIFNADGSEVGQCGNGARCFAKFVRDKHLTDKSDILVDTRTRQLRLICQDNNLITVNMGVPQHAPAEIPMRAELEQKQYALHLDGHDWQFGAVSLGNPHAVLRVDDVASAPVAGIGERLESHSLFPERVNVGFMQVVDRQNIKLRVFERGSGETSACGSGACAAVVIGIEQQWLDATVNVELRGGKLTIAWQGRNQPVYMTGPATTVYEGQFAL